MSSFLCFLCHSTVNADTNEDIREKYREVVGMHLCLDSHLCHICCHVLNKLWLFRAVCLKRSLEYPVLFSEKGTLNLQRNELEIHTICSEDICGQFHSRNINSKFYNVSHIYSDVSHHEQEYTSNQYVELQEERNDFDKYFQHDNLLTKSVIQETNDKTYLNYSPNNAFQNSHNEDFDKDYHEESNDSQCEETHNVTMTSNHLEDEDNDLENGNTELESNIISDTNPIEDNENTCNNFKVKQECFEYEEHSKIEEAIEISEKETETTKSKKKKSKKNKTKKSNTKPYEKILLTVEEQKKEIECKRKEQKYVKSEFKCYNCALGFLFKDTYLAHMMRHEESNGEYRCSICTLRFAKADVYRAHTRAHSERYKCAICGTLVVPQARKRHLQRCASDGPRAACHLCARLFQYSAGLQQHLKRFHQLGLNTRTLVCGACGQECHSQAALRTHMIKHVNRKFPCEQCSATFSSPYTLGQHKKKHSALAPSSHRCDVCGVTYTTRKGLLAHQRNSFNHQHAVLECPFCSRISPNERALSLHIEAIHSGRKNYSCPNCPAGFTNRKSLVRHMGSHYGKSQAKLAVCHLCGATFKGNNKLNRHLKEVCEKAKLEEEIANLYEQECMNPG